MTRRMIVLSPSVLGLLVVPAAAAERARGLHQSIGPSRASTAVSG